MWNVRYDLIRGCLLFLSFSILTLYTIDHATPNSFPALSFAGTEKETNADPYKLSTIQVIYQEDRWHVVLTGSESMTYKARKTVDPLRLTVDLPNTIMGSEVLPRHKENEVVGRIRTLVFISGSKLLTKVEIDLNSDASYLISRKQGKIWVSFDTSDLSTGAQSVQIESVTNSKAEGFQGRHEAATTGATLEAKTLSVQPAKRQPMKPAHQITAIKSITSDEELRIYIIADGSLAHYDIFFLDSPPRLVMDFMEVSSTTVESVQSLKGRIVKRVRVGVHPDTLRVVFDLVSEKEPSYQVILGDDRLVITLNQSA